MKKTSITLTFCFLTGCSSVDKQVFKARQIFDKYPNEAAKYCGDKFPVADSVLTVKVDSIKGKTIDYTPVLSGLQSTLDSAKATLNQKQTALTDLGGQLSFAKLQLAKTNTIIGQLTVTIKGLKESYKPCGVDTIKTTYNTIRANTAKITALTSQIVEDEKEKQNMDISLKTTQTQSAHRLYYLIAIFLLVAIYVAFKVYRFFSGGGLITGLLR